MWLDAVGLAFFCVVGASKGLEAGAGPFIAVVMAVITASFGGIIRDVIGGESPFLLRKEIYVTAALAGAVVFVASRGARHSGYRGRGRGLCGVLRDPRVRPALRACAADLQGAAGPHRGGIEAARSLSRRRSV